MRTGAILLTLATIAAAENADLFTPPVPADFGADAARGARERFAESLAILSARVTKDPGDGEAWDRAYPLLFRLGREVAFAERVKRAALTPGLDTGRLVGLKRLLARILVQQAGEMDDGNVIQQGGGFIIIRMNNGGGDREEMLKEAILHLRSVLSFDAADVAARRLLLQALRLQDEKRHAAEISELESRLPPQQEGRDVLGEALPAALDRRPEAEVLRKSAEALELQQPPDRARALELRKKALLLDYCTHTIPFECDPLLYDALSLFADPEIVNRDLTLSYLDRKGKAATTPPQHYATGAAELEQIVRTKLSRPAGAPGVAALLAIIVRGGAGEEAVALAAAEMLERERPPEAVKHLATLLSGAIYSTQPEMFALHGQALLVRLAGSLHVVEAAPLLARLADRDDDLASPLDAAVALGRVGGAENAGLLLSIAKDPSRDVYFRRRAVDGLGILAPDRLADLPADPALELSVAAARYRAAPTDAAQRGRILNALGSEHEADDAAAYCVELGIREAIPGIDEALAARKEHYSRDALLAALAELRKR